MALYKKFKNYGFMDVDNHTVIYIENFCNQRVSKDFDILQKFCFTVNDRKTVMGRMSVFAANQRGWLREHREYRLERGAVQLPPWWMQGVPGYSVLAALNNSWQYCLTKSPLNAIFILRVVIHQSNH